MHLVGLEAMTSSSILFLQWDELPFELDLINLVVFCFSMVPSHGTCIVF